MRALALAATSGALLLILACSGHRPAATEATAPEAPPGTYGRELAAAVAPPAEAQTGSTPAAEAAAEADLDEPGAQELQPGDEADDESVDAEAADDPETLLHNAMDAYESAEVFWGQGAFDDAFAALDQAYELMADVPQEGDAVLGQEKENLRNLISRRILEIYASRQTAVGNPDRSIPLEMNDDVKREIASFQGPEREFFLESYRRSGLYRPMIVAQLQEAGLPEQLSWLPLVESGFKDRALSRARALGLWQFIASTGYRYGLDRSSWIDERMDPEKSTKAALTYLTALHNLFGDWLTALAAYNCGERAVLHQIHNQTVSYFDQFWDLYARLPRETRRYVPRFLAVLAILQDPESYGFELPEPVAPVEYDTVEIARAARLETLDQALSLDPGTLTKLNPELRRNASPDAPYELKVPPGTGPVLVASLPDIPAWDPPSVSFGVHRVRRGETLSGIASRYDTNVHELMALNHLHSANRLWPGQQLQVPGGGGSGGSSVSRATEVHHRVTTGDSLWLLASRYGTTVDRIRRDNGLSGSVLHPGQVLTIHAGSSGRGGTYVVRKGDTLAGIAHDQGVSLGSLLAANRLSRASTIFPGQQLTIPD